MDFGRRVSRGFDWREGNTNWTAGTYQSLSGEPLGLTKFGDILATRLGHLKSD